MASACALAIISGKNIYNFAILENLRIFQNCFFTEGVVTGNGICCAAFCESAAQRGTNPLRHRCAMPPPPKGGRFCSTYRQMAKSSPLGELSRSD